MSSTEFSMYAPENVENVEIGSDIIPMIIDATTGDIQDGDVLCVASKIVSLSEDRVVNLGSVEPSEAARTIHQRVPRKDPRIIELMLQETGAADGARLEISGNWIGGTLPNGLKLTSAGIDKFPDNRAVLLPENADESARRIGESLMQTHSLNKLGVIITDSDGRSDRKGATQVAIGSFGIEPIRRTELESTSGKQKPTEETLCDFIAAAAGILMGQRGTGRPLVVCRGIDYSFNPHASMTDALLK